jgi:hypothetical protein
VSASGCFWASPVASNSVKQTNRIATTQTIRMAKLLEDMVGIDAERTV